MRTHGSLLQLGARVLSTRHGPFDLRVFRNLATRELVLVASRGELAGRAPLLARVHSSCVTSESLHALDCDCAGQLDSALEAIAAEGRGALFYLMQEGRGAGLVAKARDRMMVQASGHRLTTFEAYEQMGILHDQRRYGDVASAMALLGIRAPLRLLSNNPEKRLALEREKIVVSELRAVERDASLFSAHYLEAKRSTGHRLGRPLASPAALPAAVERFEPRLLPGVSDVMEMAHYLLPVALDSARDRAVGDAGTPGEGRSAWLHLHLLCDSGGAREWMALRPVAGEGSVARKSAERSQAPAPALRLVCERLPDRLGDRDADRPVAAWLEAALELDEETAWLVFVPAPAGSLGADETEKPRFERRATRAIAALEAAAPAARG